MKEEHVMIKELWFQLPRYLILETGQEIVLIQSLIGKFKKRKKKRFERFTGLSNSTQMTHTHKNESELRNGLICENKEIPGQLNK